MADSDPKKIRPFGQVPDGRRLDSEEDPLIELARIVSEDSGFYGAKAVKPEKPKSVKEEPIDRNAFSADLEAELLQELESSFAQRATPAPSGSRTTPRPSAAQLPTDDSDALLRSIEEQLGEFERRAQTSRASSTPAAPAALAAPAAPVWDERYEEPDDEAADEIEAGPPDDRDWAELSEETEYSPAEPQPVAPARNMEWRETPARERPEPRFGRGSAGTPRWIHPAEDRDIDARFARRRDDAADLEWRDRDAASGHDPESERDWEGAAPAGVASAAASGWNEIEAEEEAAGKPKRGQDDWRSPPTVYRDEPPTTFGDIDEARDSSRGDRDAADVETELTRELEPSYSDPSFGGHWQDADAEEQAEDEPRVAAVAPDTGARLAARASAQRNRARKGLLTAAAVLGVVVLGGVVAAYLRSGESGPSGTPPVISASEDAVKIEPPQEELAAGETVGEAVYSRVAGDAPPAEEQVVDGAEEPREISRIVLPPPQAESDQALSRPVGEEGDAVGAAEGSVPANAAANDEDMGVGPRRVRTYVVRPDGTIVDTSEVPAGEAAATAPSAETQVAAADIAASTPIEPVPVQTMAVDEAGETQPTPAEPAAASPLAAEAPVVMPAVPPAEALPPVAAPAVTEESPPTEMAATEPPAEAPAAPVTMSAAEDDAPVDLLTAAPGEEQAAPAASMASGGYRVQVSSQRSPDQAQSSFASMQSRFPSVLGTLQPDVQRADLGEKGIYYRVRVGPWATRAEAVEVCESLQAAGGSCFVTQ